jgi:hypothetical protein
MVWLGGFLTIGPVIHNRPEARIRQGLHILGPQLAGNSVFGIDGSKHERSSTGREEFQSLAKASDLGIIN